MRAMVKQFYVRMEPVTISASLEKAVDAITARWAFPSIKLALWPGSSLVCKSGTSGQYPAVREGREMLSASWILALTTTPASHFHICWRAMARSASRNVVCWCVCKMGPIYKIHYSQSRYSRMVFRVSYFFRPYHNVHWVVAVFDAPLNHARGHNITALAKFPLNIVATVVTVFTLLSSDLHGGTLWLRIQLWLHTYIRRRLWVTPFIYGQSYHCRNWPRMDQWHWLSTRLMEGSRK